MRYCINCGEKLVEGMNFCGRCGTPVGQVPKQGDEKKKWVILAVSLGVVMLAVAVAGILFAMGFVGNKGETVQNGMYVKSGGNVPEALAEPTSEGGESSENDEVSKGEETSVIEEMRRESQDVTTLDNVASAVAVAVANAGANASSGLIADITAIGEGSNEVEKGIVECLGDVSDIQMVGAAGRGNPVQCKWDVSTSEIKVWAGGDNDDGALCKYQKDEYGNPRRLIVEK